MTDINNFGALRWVSAQDRHYNYQSTRPILALDSKGKPSNHLLLQDSQFWDKHPQMSCNIFPSKRTTGKKL